MLLLNAAAPAALKKAKPGTRGVPRGDCAPRSRTCATWSARTASTTWTRKNHNGLDERARVVVQVQNGVWHLMK